MLTDITISKYESDQLQQWKCNFIVLNVHCANGLVLSKTTNSWEILAQHSWCDLNSFGRWVRVAKRVGSTITVKSFTIQFYTDIVCNGTDIWVSSLFFL